MPILSRRDDVHGMIDEEVRRQANDLGRLIGSAIPPDYGFALLIFGMGESKGRMNYISNAERETMTEALRELLARWEGQS
jgi:hypothetical protein